MTLREIWRSYGRAIRHDRQLRLVKWGRFPPVGTEDVTFEVVESKPLGHEQGHNEQPHHGRTGKARGEARGT